MPVTTSRNFKRLRADPTEAVWASVQPALATGVVGTDNLARYSDYENRLPRGRTYVRNGSVIDLQRAQVK